MRDAGVGGGLAEGAGEAVGILELDELQGHALVVMAHHAAPHAAENDHRCRAAA